MTIVPHVPEVLHGIDEEILLDGFLEPVPTNELDGVCQAVVDAHVRDLRRFLAQLLGHGLHGLADPSDEVGLEM